MEVGKIDVQREMGRGTGVEVAGKQMGVTVRGAFARRMNAT